MKTPIESNLIAQIKATEYLRDYNEKIKDCKDTEEYCSLVFSIIIFSKLVILQFKDLYKLDSNNADQYLEELDIAADAIAERVSEAHLKKNSN